MTTEQARDEAILSFDPFQGDFTDADMMMNKMVISCMSHECHWCKGVTAKGERVRVLRERNNEERTIDTFRFCSACCEAMAIEQEDGGEALETRAASLTTQP